MASDRLGSRYGLASLAFLAGFLCAANAAAFCGFFVSGADAQLYNNASQVVLMRKGKKLYNEFRTSPPPLAG